MKLHEYQAKAVLQQSGILIPAGIPLLSKADILAVLKKLPPGPWVVKSQVHTGGRGKAGGILKVETQEIERSRRGGLLSFRKKTDHASDRTGRRYRSETLHRAGADG